MDNEKIISEIQKILGKIRPYINGEGGDIEFVDFKDGIVYIKLTGACVGCGAMGSTFEGIETLLTEYVPEVLGVKDVTYEEM
jgi:Fe-S cluster biogenesis protein NfuA